MTHFLFYCSAKCNEKTFFCRNDVEARASVRTPSYAPARLLTLIKIEHRKYCRQARHSSNYH